MTLAHIERRLFAALISSRRGGQWRKSDAFCQEMVG